MRLLVDENLSDRFADLFRLVFKDIEPLSTKRLVGTGAKDTAIIQYMQTTQPISVLLTADLRMSRKGPESVLLLKSHIPVVFVHHSINKVRFEEQSWRLIRMWPKIRLVLERGTHPVRLRANLLTGRIEELTLANP